MSHGFEAKFLLRRTSGESLSEAEGRAVIGRAIERTKCLTVYALDDVFVENGYVHGVTTLYGNRPYYYLSILIGELLGNEEGVSVEYQSNGKNP